MAHWALTSHNERGRAAVRTVLIGGLAGVVTAVSLGRVQELQRGTGLATKDPVLLAVFDLDARLVPFEGHTWSIFNLAFKLGMAANVNVQGCDLLLKDGWH